MKTIIFSALLTLSFFSMTAMESYSEKPNQDLREQVTKLIENSNVLNIAKDDQKILITFTVNENSELVIFSNNDPKWDDLLISKLNGKKLKVDPSYQYDVYWLQINVKKS